MVQGVCSGAGCLNKFLLDFLASSSYPRHKVGVGFKNPAQNGIYDVPVSCDGTCQRRRFSLLNGTVSCTYIDIGKGLDVVSMSRYCKKCESICKMADSFE